MHYLKGDFALDIICLIPFQLVTLANNRNYLFFTIKILRISKGLQLFNVASIMSKVKAIYFESVQKIVEDRSPDAENKAKN